MNAIFLKVFENLLEGLQRLRLVLKVVEFPCGKGFLIIRPFNFENAKSVKNAIWLGIFAKADRIGISGIFTHFKNFGLLEFSHFGHWNPQFWVGRNCPTTKDYRKG